MKITRVVAIGGLIGVIALVWLMGSANPVTPAGYVGYLTQGAVFGRTKFYGLQTGPTSPGRTWLLSVTNVSVTPYTYHEDFSGNTSVLSRDNLRISFSVHLVWKVRPDRVRAFVERFSTLYDDRNPDRIVRTAYANFLQEPLRTYARDEIQRLNGLEIKDRITPVGEAISRRILELTRDTPFDVTSVVVGNIQYPEEVANAVAAKMAATQVLERKQTEIAIEEREKQKRIVQAEGIARSMEIINTRLTSQYLQHESIEAQKAMVGSPNHTTIYIPVGPMGVPIVGTFDAQGQPKK
jgi:regulator of protease activity HflC (stomatin/prohibitin superfamily)